MKFVHDDPQFFDLLAIVAGKHGIAPALVEKDYWVTHVLWAIIEQGFELWFKGGTSLSKGFGLIHRFSEDLDLKVLPGASGVPAVSSWKSASKVATRQRQVHFDALANRLSIPSASVRLDAAADPTFRSAGIEVHYDGLLMRELGAGFRPFVLLELGDARVVPFERVDLSSFVHDHLALAKLTAEFADNRPRGARCVHPLVTLLEKLDAIRRRFASGAEPAVFVRHYEDAAHVVAAASTLPHLAGYPSVRVLADEMVAQRQLAALPAASDLAFRPGRTTRWTEIRAAHAAIAPMFWGPRIPLTEACLAIRSWVAEQLE